MRLRKLAAATGVASLVLSMGAACTENTGQQGTDEESDNSPRIHVIATDPADSMGPAPEVEGAREGGTVYILRETDYEHLDPQRTYTVAGWALNHLISRTLTTFREDGSGRMVLVGDLATTPGEDVNGDCTTWRFTLKEGIRFETGEEITASDVAHGIARSFEQSLDGGATYIQEWLAGTPDYNSVYAGPFTSGQPFPPNLEVDDEARTLTFHFDRPRCDMPFAAAMTTTAPVPRELDTGVDYDRSVVSSGPYRIAEYERDHHILLVRNEHWDPNTDPLRHQYPDQFYVEMGPDDTTATERVVADNGNDRFAIAEDGVPQALISEVLDNPDVEARSVSADTSMVWYLRINTRRVTDLSVRQAIAYALDRQSILIAQGGEAAGTLTHTILSPQTIGYEEYENPYDAPPTGDPERARELLDGRTPELVMLYRNASVYPELASIVEESLEEAGFQVTITPIEQPEHNPMTRDPNNPYDLYMSSWIPDWPSGAATIPPLLDGRNIGGGSNNTFLDVPEINEEIDRISALPAEEAAPEWMALDQRIMEEYCPMVPIYSIRALNVVGSGVGGVFISDFLGQPAYYNAYVIS